MATPREVEEVLKAFKSVLVLLAKEATLESELSIPHEFIASIREFNDVFLEELPARLPSIRGIEHQIDIILGAVLPNQPTYRCNPKEDKELMPLDVYV